jgi:alanine racemase
VVGAINMDQITVDVTEFHTGFCTVDPHEWIGSEVELVSRDVHALNHLPRIAAQSGLIVHEFLTRLNPRITRTVSLGGTGISADVVASTRPSIEAVRVNAAAG